jgi:branched-chain amino acid transport system substrate-binding protein
MRQSHWWRRAEGLLGLLVVGAAVVGCGSSSSSTASGSGGSSSAATAGSTGTAGASSSGSKSPFHILFISGLSGPLAVYGANALEGIKAGAAEVNQTGGIDGHPVVVTSKDDASLPSNAVTQLESALSGGSKPDAVINGVDGDEGLATTPLLTQAKVIGMNITPNEAYINPSKNPYEFTTNPSYPNNMSQMAQSLSSHGVHKLAIIYVADETGVANTSLLVSAANKVGISTVAQVSFSPTALDMTPAWLRAAAAHPDGYALITQGQSPVALKGRAAAGITAFTQCDTTCGANPLAKLDPPAALHNTYTMNVPVSLTPPAKRTQGEQTFVAELKKLGFPNDLVVPSLEYDFVLMLAQAGKQAGSIDTSALTTGLEHVSLSPSTTGTGMGMGFTPTSHFAPLGESPLIVFPTTLRFVGDVFLP